MCARPASPSNSTLPHTTAEKGILPPQGDEDSLIRVKCFRIYKKEYDMIPWNLRSDDNVDSVISFFISRDMRCHGEYTYGFL